jgi:hypothetical protein
MTFAVWQHGEFLQLPILIVAPATRPDTSNADTSIITALPVLMAGA